MPRLHLCAAKASIIMHTCLNNFKCNSKQLISAKIHDHDHMLIDTCFVARIISTARILVNSKTDLAYQFDHSLVKSSNAKENVDQLLLALNTSCNQDVKQARGAYRLNMIVNCMCCSSRNTKAAYSFSLTMFSTLHLPLPSYEPAIVDLTRWSWISCTWESL